MTMMPRSLMATTPGGGSVGQMAVRGQQQLSAGASMQLPTGSQGLVGMGRAVTDAETARRGLEYGAAQDAYTLQAEAAQAQQILANKLVNDHKMIALGCCGPGGGPMVPENLIALAQRAGAV